MKAKKEHPAINNLLAEVFGKNNYPYASYHSAGGVLLKNIEGKVIAFAYLRPRYAKTGWNEAFSVAVSKSERRQGFGTRLMKELLARSEKGIWLGPDVDAPEFYRNVPNCYKLPNGRDGIKKDSFIWLMSKTELPEGSYWSDKTDDVVLPK